MADYSDIGVSKYKSDLGSGNDGGDFTYGSGRSISMNSCEDTVDYDCADCGGTTEAQQALTNWDKDADGDEIVFRDYQQGPAK